MQGQGKLFGILSSILKDNAYKRTNGHVASERTVTAYTEVLNMCFDQLHDLGFKLQNPRNLTEEHVRALCQKWHADGKAASTMQEYLSKLRVFSTWICKERMVKSLNTYLPDVDKKLLIVRKAAQSSKSWSQNGIDVKQKIMEADALDRQFGLMLRMMLAFGLRRKEVTHNRPWKADLGHKLVIYLGEAKGGRPRDIFIDTVEQRQVLDYVKSQIRLKSDYLGWQTTTRGQRATLKYSIGRYNRCMAAIGITKLGDGVTGHGLRAQYAENAALIAHIIPPTLGGTPGQMPRDVLDVKRAQVSELLGHSRIDVTSAYYGSFGREVNLDEVSRATNNINAALVYLKNPNLPPVAAERMADCGVLIAELTAIHVDITPKQIQALWVLHSERFGTDWVAPRAGNAQALEAAAFLLKIGRSIDRAKETDRPPN